MSETFSTKSFIVAENLGKAFTRAGLTETTFWPCVAFRCRFTQEN